MIDVELNFSDGRLNEVLELALKTADSLDKKIDEIQASLNRGFSGGGSNKLSDSLKNGAKSAQDADAALKKFGVTAGLSFAKFNILADAVQGFGTGIADFVGNTVQSGATLESLESNFTTLLKSADAAKQLIDEINQFAAETRFSQSQLFGQTEKLLGFGFAADEVTDTLRRLGDISGGSSEKLDRFVTTLAQVRAKGRLQGEELLQFAEAGLGTNLIAEALGQTSAQFSELVSQGKIGYSELQRAIEVLTDEGGRFNGVMAAQAQTFNGLFSTLTGNFEQLQGEVGKLLLPALKDVVTSANDIISGIDPKQIGVAFQQAGQAVEPFLDTLSNGFDQNILPALIRFRDAIQEAFDRVADFFSGVNEGGAAAEFLQSVLDGITVAFEHLINTLSFAVEGIVDFAGPIVEALAPAVNTVLRVLGGAIDAFSELAGEGQRTGTIFGTLAQPFTVVANGIALVVEVIGEAVAGFLNLGDNARSSTPWIRTFGEVIEFLTTPIRVIAGGIVDLVQGIGDFLGITETATEKAQRLRQEAEAAAAVRATANAGEDFADRQRQTQEREKAAKEAELQRKRQEERRKAAATKTQSELKKEADARAKFEKDQADLRIDLIEDETAQLIAKEKQRFEAQQKEIKRLITNKQELQTQEAAAARIHAANIEKIEREAAEKIIEERTKVLEREREFEQERQAIRAETQANAADNAKTLGDLRLDIAEAAQVAYLQKLKQQGETEQTLQEEQARFDLVVQSLRLQNEIEFQEALLAATAAGDEQRRAQIELQLQLLRQQLANVTFEINAPDDLGAGGILQKLTNLKSSIASALKIDPETFGNLLSGAKDAFGSFFDSLDTLRQVQIDRNQQLIDSLDEMIAKQEEVVEKEKASKEQGAANSLDIEQKTLDELQAKKEAAEKKNQELQARSARFQILQDAASQASGIATSVVNIIRGTSAVPFVGVALAAIQVAALFALIAQARAQAKAATKLYRGGKIPLGKDDERGQGYRIEGTNIEVGGGEFVVRRKVVEKHENFIEKLNRGKYDHLDLERELDQPGESKPPEAKKVRREKTERVFLDVKRAQSEAIQKAAIAMQKFVLDAIKTERDTNETKRLALERSEMAIRHILSVVDNNVWERKKSLTLSVNDVVGNAYLNRRERVDRHEAIQRSEAKTAKTTAIFETAQSNIERSKSQIEINETARRRRETIQLETLERLDRMVSNHVRIAYELEKMQTVSKSLAEHVVFEHLREFPAMLQLPEMLFLQPRQVHIATETIKGGSGVLAPSMQSGINQESIDVDYKRLEKMFENQTNRIIRQGLFPLQKLGESVSTPDGKIVVRSTDASGVISTTVKA